LCVQLLEAVSARIAAESIDVSALLASPGTAVALPVADADMDDDAVSVKLDALKSNVDEVSVLPHA
jgi:hypothetical protein